MPDYAEIGGVPFKVSPGQQQDLANMGGVTPMAPEEAHRRTQAIGEIAAAEDKYGTAGAAAMGFGSGLTLGMGPGFAAAMGFLNPTDVAALEGTGAYQAGDIAGMVLPTILSGGEAAGARGLLGSAARLTPAGLMGRLGGQAERLATRLLPGSGSIAKSAVSMAARGATEGAIINVGHTIGDSLIQNKPLTAEAMWAAGTDGALAGGLLGGGMGLVGGIGAKLTEKLPGAVSGAAGAVSEKSLSRVARRLGMTTEQVAEASAEEGGLKAFLEKARRPLDIDNQGVTYGSSTEALRESYKRAGDVSRLARSGVVETLDQQAPLAVPREARFASELHTEAVNPFLGRMGAKDIARSYNQIINDVKSIEAVYGSKGELIGTKPGSWKAWVDSRDTLEKGIIQGKYPAGVPQEMAKKALRIMDREIESAMKSAANTIGEGGLAEKFAAAQLDIKYARELHETVGKKAAQELLAHETTFTPRDISVFGGMAVVGNPGLALGWAAAKGVSRRINNWAEPAMAEAAYRRALGTRAVGAEQKATIRIRDSVRNFFRASGTSARTAAASHQARDRNKPKSNYSREAYERAASRAEQLVSANHQQNVQNLIEGLHLNGYADFARALAESNQRAVQYLQMNIPPRRAADGLGSLRATPKIHGLDMKEFKFLRVFNGVSSPFAVLDKLNDGTMSRDEVRAVKYVYPELHGQIVQEAAQQIAQMKAAGEHMPMDKIAHLGVILDAPIDTMLQADRISSIQASFIPPEAPQGQAPAPPPQQIMIDPMIQTPLEQMV